MMGRTIAMMGVRDVVPPVAVAVLVAANVMTHLAMPGASGLRRSDLGLLDVMVPSKEGGHRHPVSR